MKYELKQCVRKATLFNISQVSINLLHCSVIHKVGGESLQDLLSQACLRPIGLLQIK